MAEPFAPASTSPAPPVNAPSAEGTQTRPPVAIVGAGAVGGALARRLHMAGYPVTAVLSRSAQSAQQLAAAVEAPTASTTLRALPDPVRLLFLCVPDDQVRLVAQTFADHSHPWKRCLVAHTSGALPAAALHPLQEKGAATLSFHPLQAFDQEARADAFDGIYIGLEGSDEALAMGRTLAEALNVESFVLSEEKKERYHLAASIASNFLITLLDLARNVLDEALSHNDSHNNNKDVRADRLRPLVEGTLRNLERSSPSTALTGPVARGDGETIRAHLHALRRHHPDLVPVYAALTAETVHLATRADRLSSQEADRILDLLSEALETL